MAKSLSEIMAEHRARKEKEENERKAKENAPVTQPSQAAQETTVAAQSTPKRGFLSRIAANKSAEEPTPPPAQQTQVVAERVQTTVPGNLPTVQSMAVAPVSDIKSDDIATLRRNLDYLAEHIEHKELVGQVVRNIAAQLQENPQFSSQMADADFNLIVRGLRKSFNTAARKKSEGVAKKKASDNETSEILEMLKGAGISLSG
jgi:hypothetical protein